MQLTLLLPLPCVSIRHARPTRRRLSDRSSRGRRRAGVSYRYGRAAFRSGVPLRPMLNESHFIMSLAGGEPPPAASPYGGGGKYGGTAWRRGVARRALKVADEIARQPNQLCVSFIPSGSVTLAWSSCSHAEVAPDEKPSCRASSSPSTPNA